MAMNTKRELQPGGGDVGGDGAASARTCCFWATRPSRVTPRRPSACATGRRIAASASGPAHGATVTTGSAATVAEGSARPRCAGAGDRRGQHRRRDRRELDALADRRARSRDSTSSAACTPSFNDTPQLKSAAERHGRRLIDVRTPPQNIPIATGRKRSGKRLLTVGTDCALGKKYSALGAGTCLCKARSGRGFSCHRTDRHHDFGRRHSDGCRGCGLRGRRRRNVESGCRPSSIGMSSRGRVHCFTRPMRACRWRCCTAVNRMSSWSATNRAAQRARASRLRAAGCRRDH